MQIQTYGLDREDEGTQTMEYQRQRIDQVYKLNGRVFAPRVNRRDEKKSELGLNYEQDPYTNINDQKVKEIQEKFGRSGEMGNDGQHAKLKTYIQEQKSKFTN